MHSLVAQKRPSLGVRQVLNQPVPPLRVATESENDQLEATSMKLLARYKNPREVGS